MEPEEFADSFAEDIAKTEWFEPFGKQPDIIPFTGQRGADVNNVDLQNCVHVEDFYALLVTDEMVQQISDETNLYAAQKEQTNLSSREKRWIPTNKEEIRKLFGLLIWMGLVKYPSIESYWSTNVLYQIPFPSTVMSRNRFEILLTMLHFSNNETADTSNSLYKINPLVNGLNENFQKYYHPPEVLYIGQSIIPTRGRVVYRQNMKQEQERYGTKIIKLNCGLGYTYSFSVYCGKTYHPDVDNSPTSIAMKLCGSILFKGHTLYTDNCFTNLNLAKQLIVHDTHLIGSVKNNRKDNPKDVVNKELKRGEFVAKESKEGITFMKWKDAQEVLLLSTKHSVQMETVTSSGKSVPKPKLVVDYNSAKKSYDLSDQMAAFSSPLRKTMKWYRKVAIELLLNTAVLNSYVLYRATTGQAMPKTKFREKLVLGLTQKRDSEQRPESIASASSSSDKHPVTPKNKNKHHLDKKEGIAQKVRRYCASCYSYNTQLLGRAKARNITKKVITFCGQCKSQPHLCLECFNKLH
ncbi:piggyBac transposable element-derived protein 4-like protein [Anopheles sinensis]|uniref:DDE_Tnp_1_7 domain-containing protein n=1 Tax=Anopheles sinensis TaxID=74873 RepID=A0A084W7H9_ANOSI|nr:piggyBac transposable element-derived protein 4-like protein [Anopheles sinensis]